MKKTWKMKKLETIFHFISQKTQKATPLRSWETKGYKFEKSSRSRKETQKSNLISIKAYPTEENFLSLFSTPERKKENGHYKKYPIVKKSKRLKTLEQKLPKSGKWIHFWGWDFSTKAPPLRPWIENCWKSKTEKPNPFFFFRKTKKEKKTIRFWFSKAAFTHLIFREPEETPETTPRNYKENGPEFEASGHKFRGRGNKRRGISVERTWIQWSSERKGRPSPPQSK